MLDTIIILPSILLVLLLSSIHYIAYHSTPFSSGSEESDSSIWNFERSGVIISLWTSSLNNLPKSILNKFNIKLARRLKIIYNSGIGFGLLGMLFALSASLWATWLVWKEVWLEISLHTIQKVNESQVKEVGDVVKRALEEDLPKAAVSSIVQKGNWDFAGGLQPLIPGLTMPWTHLPTLVSALVANQLIHEFGHAISAALDEVQMSRFSFTLHAGIPSMMVSFPSTIDTLDPNAKMRLATSGPLHNLLTWFFLWLLTSGGVGNLFWYDRSGEGSVVQDVHWNSPLYPHLPIGSLITHLDDIPISASTSSPDPWSEYLSSDKTGDEGRGWCMDKSIFLSQPEPDNQEGCFTNSTSSSKIIFESIYGLTKGQSKCLKPRPILNIKSTKCPCPDNRWVCIKPKESENILRISISQGKGNNGRNGNKVDGEVILFTGPREEVLRDVNVSNKDARGWKGGVRWSELFLGYISTISLSLFLFNLLPLPLTDGSQLLVSLLQWKSTIQPSVPMTSIKATINNEESSGPNIKLYKEYEIDSDEEEEYIGTDLSDKYERNRESRGKEVRWKRWTRRLVQWSTLGIIGAWSTGWAMLFLLRSS